MLKSLSIDNIAVTRHLDVDFPKGYTVITGETGAGKSILIDCMGLLAGDRAGRDMIRTGENRACVCGVFDELSAVAPALQECGVEVDENGEVEIQSESIAGRHPLPRCARSDRISSRSKPRMNDTPLPTVRPILPCSTNTPGWIRLHILRRMRHGWQKKARSTHSRKPCGSGICSRTS